jgi:UDPglucose 6-dehydrogenase
LAVVGWIGLGKLGLPCALALAKYGGNTVIGYDRSPRAADIIAGRVPPPVWERGMNDLLGCDSPFMLAETTAAVVEATDDLVLVSVQTPHDPEYGGDQPMPEHPKDFEYGFLVQAVRDLVAAARRQHKRITIVVVSTVLPGTTRRLLAPLCGEDVDLVYGPYFIAMGTTIYDFLKPEFALLGSDSTAALDRVTALYRTVHDRPVHMISIESAELLKVAYNCFISTKIVYANMIMEICHKTGADCDEIVDGLALATDRVTSAAYLRGGMGDAGACHPRDNQAMSWLADRLDLSVDLMGFVSMAREAQSSWLAGLVQHWAHLTGLPVTLLGKAYKAGVGLTDGSAGLLLAAQLHAAGLTVRHWDPHVEGDRSSAGALSGPRVFVIATRHDEFRSLTFESGSVVIDPFGYLADQPGVTFIRLGRKI